MSHVSKKEMDKGVEKRIADQLFQTFKSAGRESISSLLSELLTPTERVMFAKRLSIIFLLDKGMPEHLIVEYLQVSSSTITRLSRDLDKGKYRRIVQMSGSRKERALNTLIKLIFFSMPPRVGRGRWKNVEHLFDS